MAGMVHIKCTLHINLCGLHCSYVCAYACVPACVCVRIFSQVCQIVEGRWWICSGRCGAVEGLENQTHIGLFCGQINYIYRNF